MTLTCIDVRPKAHIPLHRPTMAVSLNNVLKITATLYEYNKLTKDNEIANGSVQFNVDIMKSAEASIRGQSGQISVRVQWS